MRHHMIPTFRVLHCSFSERHSYQLRTEQAHSRQSQHLSCTRVHSCETANRIESNPLDSSRRHEHENTSLPPVSPLVSSHSRLTFHRITPLSSGEIRIASSRSDCGHVRADEGRDEIEGNCWQWLRMHHLLVQYCTPIALCSAALSY